jgi:hypothetical protein
MLFFLTTAPQSHEFTVNRLLSSGSLPREAFGVRPACRRFRKQKDHASPAIRVSQSRESLPHPIPTPSICVLSPILPLLPRLLTLLLLSSFFWLASGSYLLSPESCLLSAAPSLKNTFKFLVARPDATISSLPSPFRSAKQRSSQAIPFSSKRTCCQFEPSASFGMNNLMPTLPCLSLPRQPTTT